MNVYDSYMLRALELAKLGWGRTNPNPLVGALIVKEGKIIAEGYHEKLGSDHAEVVAFKNAKEDVSGGTLYVNLEPCSHYGRTSPCARAIIEKKISQVVIAMTDPNPIVAGSGIKMLKEAGIQVGINTILVDDPSLTTRLDNVKTKDPVRIVIDSKGLIPLDSRVINVESSAGLVLATTSAIGLEKERLLIDKGVKILKLDGLGGHVDLVKLMGELYKLEIDSVLLEGGGGLNAASLKSGIVDKVMTFIAPKIIGGKDAKTPVEGVGIELMQDALKLRDISITRFDDDFLIEGYVEGDLCLQE
jgi:diaminohydroxyphosphoribosylaminopyrimidine deaminase/5-amino-6-(5-phosphoribosylamino)uracil reductase